MNRSNLDTGQKPSAEIGAEPRRRHTLAAGGIARACASAAAGRIVSFEAVDAWIDSLDTDHALPAPRPGQ